MSKKPMGKNPQGENDFRPVRFMEAGIRAMSEEENERRFELSFSSEEPYDRWYGTEILDHSEGCMDLSRLQSIGVVLFNHNTSRVIGKIEKAWNEDGRGKAVIAFDDDDESETIRKKVSGGTLKGVSVGYQVHVWEEVKTGKTSTDGRFKGPCYIARKWTPFSKFSLACTIFSKTKSFFKSPSRPSSILRPTPTVGSAGTETTLISKGVHFLAM